mmetsp:Transcript_134563/g.335778  ORF Transcript_134563/g.335778 Transcript_134563/m.335778 type:complete len:250 (-) Transcript_134563:302-1051(-)
MIARAIWLGLVISRSYAANMTWHLTADCSDNPVSVMSNFPSAERGAVPSQCFKGFGSTFNTIPVDPMWDKCNETHFGMSIYAPETDCTQTFGTLAIPIKEVKKVFRGECVAVLSECCGEDGQPKEVPDVEYVKMHGYVGVTPLCPHCIGIPKSKYDDLVSKGFLPVTCEEDKVRRRMQGLPEGPPCPHSAKTRNLLKKPHDPVHQQNLPKPVVGKPWKKPLRPFWAKAFPARPKSKDNGVQHGYDGFYV